jgi:hypothetical protein
MKVQYTPGPWLIPSDHPDWICPPGSGYPIAMVPPGQGAVAAANARLIAAAPELVDALVGMLEQFGEHGGPVVKQTRAVLAKAAATPRP